MTEPGGAVFLSYASQDAEAARRICESLRAAGIEVWFDQSELRGGDVWDRQITRQIRDCTLFIPVISATTQGRAEGYFRREWRLAVERTRDMSERVAFLVPVVIDSTGDAEADVPESFRAVQWTRLPGGETPLTFVARVAHLLSPQAPQAAPHALTKARATGGSTPVGRSSAAAAPASRRPGLMLMLTVAVVLAAGGYFALHRFVLSKRPTAAALAASGQGAIADRSIAVLPFTNMSSDAAQDYLSDGITAEITSKLSGLKGLKVKARTAVLRYKGSTLSPSQIGAELGVGWLLEGSVVRAGDRIRVTTSLLKAEDGFEVWSEHDDAKIDDIFATQEHIAARTVEALAMTLTPAERRSLADWGTHSAAAYDEYLQGEVLYERVDNRARFDASRPHFERALAIDPGFAPAMAGLASVEAQTYRDFDTDPARLARAEDLVRRALGIDPHLGRTLMAAGEVRVARYDYDGAAEAFAQVTEVEPENYIAWDLRCWAEGYRTPPHAVEAEQYCRRALQINPGFSNALYHLARALLQLGKFADADRAIAQLEEAVPGSSLGSSGHFWSDLYQRRPRQALGALNGPEQGRTPLSAAWRAMAYAQLGELDPAFENLAVALAGGYRDVGELRSSQWFAPLRKDARFEQLLGKYGIRL